MYSVMAKSVTKVNKVSRFPPPWFRSHLLLTSSLVTPTDILKDCQLDSNANIVYNRLNQVFDPLLKTYQRNHHILSSVERDRIHLREYHVELSFRRCVVTQYRNCVEALKINSVLINIRFHF